ncbi:carbohydrate ABC transporter permease [Marinomonas sp. C2222]|uniref:Carbohydrate ABC transporter permease n=1 Tax=Marinomonas sargassi TaxID=2984494 RepID=A0ABT2YW23_9GAMM|nr:carbohydrate ABC transporter permease [Marinomonas sargassi]MCV2404000.1 carbohydrate ABC transporter permease [Marinomonas sargassi]
MSDFNLYSRGDKVFGYANMFLIGLFVLSTLYPFVYIFSASISSGFAVSSGQVIFLPKEITFAAYDKVLSDVVFWKSYANTFFYTIFGTLVSLAIIIPGAYALSKPSLVGRRYFNFFIAFTMWFNAGMIPFFLNLRDLDLLDSRFGILIAFACTAFNIILLRNFFEAIPKSFEEAARMDGAGEFSLLWKVFIPLSKPAIVTVALFCIVARWNGYFWAMILLQEEDKIPLQVYLKRIIIEANMDDEFASTLLSSSYSFETIVAAIIVVSIIPVLMVYPYLQKHFNKGIMMGGVKE